MKSLERLAYYGVRAVIPLYLILGGGSDGLNLTYEAKSRIYLAWGLLTGLSVFVSAHFTDRWGYRKSLTLALALTTIGYLCMALSKPITDALNGSGWESAGSWTFLLAICLVGCGSGAFAPAVYGTIAHVTTRQTWSMGWGILYWLVNIGAFFGPLLTGWLHAESDWHYVFCAAAVVSAANLLLALRVYREPERDAPPPSARGARLVFDAVRAVFKDRRFIVFLVIFACSSVAFGQASMLLPVYVEQWADTSDVAPLFSGLGDLALTQTGQIAPYVVINVSLCCFMLLLPLVAWATGRLNTITAIVVGMLVTVVGSAACATGIGWVCLVMLLVVAVGEIMFSIGAPGYVGHNAPKASKALYMGYFLTLPGLVGLAPGFAIAEMAGRSATEKAAVAREYLVEALGMNEAFVMDEGQLPDEQVMPTVAHVLEKRNAVAVQESIRLLRGEVNWDELGYFETREKVSQIFGSVLGDVDMASLQQATQVLRQQYKPYLVWCYYGALGLVAAIAMLIFKSRAPSAL